MSKKTVLRFTTKELNTLVNNVNAHVELITTKRKISLHPICLNDVKASVHEVLDASLARFDHELKGILLSYKNIKVLKSLAKLLHDDPCLYVTIRADFYVFRPEVGCTLFGMVNKKSPDHLGCLVHKIFNVALPRPDKDEEWQGFYVEPGETVTFTVDFVDLTGSLPYMRGRLLENGNFPDVEENSNNEDQEEENDNEEGKLSTSLDIKDLMDSAASHFQVVKKPKKKKTKKEKISFDSSDVPERITDMSSLQSLTVDKREKKVKLKRKTKGSTNNNLTNEFKLHDDENECVSQEDFVLSKTKDKGTKKRKQNDFENTYETAPNFIGPEHSSNDKIKKQKHKSVIKQESTIIDDVKIEKSDMTEGSDSEGQNISPLKVLESAENLIPKTKKKKKKKIHDDADESILSKDNFAPNSLMTDNLKPKQITKLNSILSDDLREVATSTPKEQKEFQKFISNMSEIKRRFSTDEIGTPKAHQLSKKQKLKKVGRNEKNLNNLTNTNLDYINKIESDIEMNVKHFKKERTKDANESNGSISSSSGSPGKRKLIKSKEKQKSGSVSEACNLLLENMLSKFNTMQEPNCDTNQKESDTSLNVKSSKKRNSSLGSISSECVKTIERDEKFDSDFSSHSSDNEFNNDCSVTKNVNKMLNAGEASTEKLKKYKTKTEILNTANPPINKLNERSPRKSTKKKHNALDLSVGNSIETEQSLSQSGKSPTKKNKNSESDDTRKVKQTKKSDATSWELPDSLMEIQKNILEKLKLEMSPSKDKNLKSEMSPTMGKNFKPVMSPTKVKNLKSPINNKKLKVEASPAEDKKIEIEMSPTKNRKLKRKRHSDDGTFDNIDEKPTTRKLAKLEHANDKQSEGEEASETMSKIIDSPIKGKKGKNKILYTSNKTAEEGEKLGSTIEDEKETLLHKMLNNMAGVIKLEESVDVKGRKETKKERKKSKQVEEEINNSMPNLRSGDPLEKRTFQQKCDKNSITHQDEKCELYGKKPETKKKKKKKDKEGDGNVSGEISNAIDGFLSLNKDVSEANIVNKLVSAAAKNGNSKKTKQKEQPALTCRNDPNENLKQVSHLAPEEPRQEKGKKSKTKKNNAKVGVAETQEPDHRKKEKRHSAISQQEEESPAALAERLLQEFIKQKKK